MIPPTNVYKTTPTGSRNVAAIMWMPVLVLLVTVSTVLRETYRAVIAADAPSNMLATAMMLLIRQRPMYTICAVVPILSVMITVE